MLIESEHIAASMQTREKDPLSLRVPLFFMWAYIMEHLWATRLRIVVNKVLLFLSNPNQMVRYSIIHKDSLSTYRQPPGYRPAMQTQNSSSCAPPRHTVPLCLKKRNTPRFPNSYYPLADSRNIPFVCLLQEGRFYETAIQLLVRSRTSSKLIFARSSNFLA